MTRIVILFFAIFLLFVTIVASAQTPAVTIDRSVALFDKVEGDQITTIPPHSVLTLLGVEGSWAQVRWQLPGEAAEQVTGWLDSAVIEVTGSSALNSSIKPSFIAKSQDCAWSREAKGKVCVDTREAVLDCRKSAVDEYWRRCEAKVGYALFSELGNPQSIEVEVHCDIGIEYKLSDSFQWQVQENKFSQRHRVNPEQRLEYTQPSLFSFSDYEQVTNVKIEKLDCEVEV